MPPEIRSQFKGIPQPVDMEGMLQLLAETQYSPLTLNGNAVVNLYNNLVFQNIAATFEIDPYQPCFVNGSTATGLHWQFSTEMLDADHLFTHFCFAEADQAFTSVGFELKVASGEPATVEGMMLDYGNIPVADTYLDAEGNFSGKALGFLADQRNLEEAAHFISDNFWYAHDQQLEESELENTTAQQERGIMAIYGAPMELATNSNQLAVPELTQRETALITGLTEIFGPQGAAAALLKLLQIPEQTYLDTFTGLCGAEISLDHRSELRTLIENNLIGKFFLGGIRAGIGSAVRLEDLFQVQFLDKRIRRVQTSGHQFLYNVTVGGEKQLLSEAEVLVFAKQVVIEAFINTARGMLPSGNQE